jgi:uncharacterized membrane protein
MQVYSSGDFESTKKILMLYNISHIYLGSLEKAYYDTSGFERVVENNPLFFQKVYTNPDVSIYKFVADGKYN